MAGGNSLQPELDWGTAAAQFQGKIGRQAFLCVRCVNEGNTVPPAQLVVLNGDSVCLDHALNDAPPPIPMFPDVPKP